MTISPTPGRSSQSLVGDFEPETDAFRADVVAGLSQDPRILHCKYLYDEKGSKLFDRICEVEEYYPTRTESKIMRQRAGEIADAIGPRAMIIEPGSGSSAKTPLLLDALEDPAAYVPVEISREHLIAAARRLRERYPDLEILAVCADFTADYELPEPAKTPARRVVFFPGSTIGNFTPPEARTFLKRVAKIVGKGGGLLIGADLRKDRATLEAAYNDAAGVSAAFNMNLLSRINRELDGDFDLERWEHRAIYNEPMGRVEMHLFSLADQTVTIDGEEFSFEKGESIRTELSHKTTVPGFAEIVGAAGFRHVRAWTDEKSLFSVHWCVVD